MIHRLISFGILSVVTAMGCTPKPAANQRSTEKSPIAFQSNDAASSAASSFDETKANTLEPTPILPNANPVPAAPSPAVGSDPSAVVKYVDIPYAWFDGAGQIWLNYKTGELKFKSCLGGGTGCVTTQFQGKSAAPSLRFPEVTVVYMDGHQERISISHSSIFNSNVDSFQLPGKWSTNTDAEIVARCIDLITASRINPTGSWATYWRDRLRGAINADFVTPADWVGIEVDDSDSYVDLDGEFALHLTIHLSKAQMTTLQYPKDGTLFEPHVSKQAATWALSGAYDGAYPYCNRETAATN